MVPRARTAARVEAECDASQRGKKCLEFSRDKKGRFRTVAGREGAYSTQTHGTHKNLYSLFVLDNIWSYLLWSLVVGEGEREKKGEDNVWEEKTKTKSALQSVRTYIFLFFIVLFLISSSRSTQAPWLLACLFLP